MPPKLPTTPGSYQPGSMGVNPRTAGWRLREPVLDAAKCDQCLKCWIYCPDVAIEVAADKVAFTLDYCKGCGICETECPEGAIKMVPRLGGA